MTETKNLSAFYTVLGGVSLKSQNERNVLAAAQKPDERGRCGGDGVGGGGD